MKFLSVFLPIYELVPMSMVCLLCILRNLSSELRFLFAKRLAFLAVEDMVRYYEEIVPVVLRKDSRFLQQYLQFLHNQHAYIYQKNFLMHKHENRFKMKELLFFK